MSVESAKKFIQESLTQPEWIASINAAPDVPSVQGILAEVGLSFNYDDFEQAYYYWLTQCQTVEQAETLQGIKTWWDCLGITLIGNTEEMA